MRRSILKRLTTTLAAVTIVAAAGCENGTRTVREYPGEADTVLTERYDQLTQLPENERLYAEDPEGPLPLEEDRARRPDRPGRVAGMEERGLGELNGRRNVLALPTGERETSFIVVSAMGPEALRVGEAADYRLEVTNITDLELRDVTVTSTTSPNLRIIGAEPPTTGGPGAPAVWALGTLGPGESQTILVNAEATQTGVVELCVTADYVPFICVVTNVTQPQLQLVKRGREEVLICEPIEYVLEISNPGTGPARNVRIVDELPEGLATADGRRRIAFDVGTLPAGETREFTYEVTANEPGTFSNVARANAAGDLSAEAAQDLVVVAPNLEITKTGPQRDYIGAPIRYTITVRNTGDGPARDAVLVDRVPAGGQFVSATENGRVEGRQVTWDLGTLEPGAERTVRVTVEGTEMGDLRNVALATAYCADEVEAAAVTEVVGIPALLLEVVDTQDPVRVGNETTYVITVLNQGSEVANNIAIRTELPEALTYVTGQGPTPANAQGQAVAFAPLPRLAPGASATWRVTARATGTEDARFFVEMRADQFGPNPPARETEPTTLYSYEEMDETVPEGGR